MISLSSASVYIAAPQPDAGLNFLTPRQVCDSACQFEDSVIRPRRQIELGHRDLHWPLTLILKTKTGETLHAFACFD